ncbi:MAG: peptidylprolyl isomerase [Candidatus Kapaibacterium sp.]
MGTFERIRTLSPWILTAFAVVFILFMALADADLGGLSSATNNPQTMAIATVNGDEVKYIDYEKNVTQEVENRRQQNPDAPLDDKQIRNQMWTTMIDGQLVDQYSKKVGAFVTDEVVAYELLNNPPDFMKQRFTDSAGNFQSQTYIELLTDPQTFYTQRAPDMDPAEKQKALKQFRDEINMITAYLKDQKQQQLLTNAVTLSTGIVSKTFARQTYIDENTTSDVTFIQLPAASISDDQIKITDEELKAYYEKNKARFKQDATRKLKYASFRIEPSSQDTASIVKKQNLLSSLLNSAPDSTTKDSVFSEKLRDFNGSSVEYTIVNDIEPRLAQFVMNMKKGDIKGPIKASDGTYFIRIDDVRTGTNKVVKASHILINFDNNKDSSKAEATRILKEAKSGKNFAELATKYTKDPSGSANGGDLGFFGKGQMVPAFEEAAFAAKVGDIVGPVETSFGYHIIKIDDSKSEEYKYSFIKLTPKTSGITKNQTIRDAVSFKKQLEEGENIDDLATKLGVVVQETGPINKNTPTLTSQYLTDITFNAEKGEVLEPLELDNYGYIVAVVSDVQKKGTAPFDAVIEDVRARVRNKKALEVQMKNAKDIYSNIKGSGDLAAAAAANPTINVKTATAVANNGTIPGGGRDYFFTSAVSKAPLNTIAEPIMGQNSVYIAQVTNRNQPSKEQIKTALPAFIEQLKAKYSRESFYLWLNQVKKDAEIEDFRYKQYKSY